MDDLQNLPEPSRSRAKALLTCRLCSKYLVDPRVLPCRHSFCRKCLQTLYDGLQAAAVPSSRRVGSMPCPACQQPIGVPLTGMRGFPIDTKIARIKDLVVNEMAQNLSKKINGMSDTSSTKSDNADDDDKSTKSADDVTTDPRHRRDHSYDNMAGRGAGGGVETGPGYRRNPAYPDFAKFARYFDHDGKPANPTEFKPTIKPDRHRVGYSHSFGHQRRRVTVRMRAYDDTAGLLDDLSGSAAHVDRTNGGAPAPDQRGEEGASAYKRSRSARPGLHRRQRSPDRFDEEAEISGKAEKQVPLPRTRPTNDSSAGLTKESVKAANGTQKAGLDAVLDEAEGKQRRPLRSADLRAERPSRTRPTMPATSLPVHRENILTETSETGRYFGGTEPKPGEPKTKPGEPEPKPRTSSVRFSDSSDGTKPTTGRRLPKTPSNSSDATDFGAKSRTESTRSSQARSSGSGERGEESREGSSEGKHRSGSGGENTRKARSSTTSGDDAQAPRVSSSYVTTRRPPASVESEFDAQENDDPVFATPKTKPVFETPKSKQTYETPRAKPVFDTPSSKPVFETPKTKPVFETPRTKPVFETPKTKPDFESAKSSRPVFDTPRSKPVFETPKTKQDFDTAKTRPVFETPPKTKPIFETPKSSKPIFETPKRPQAADDNSGPSRSTYNTARRPERPEFTEPSKQARDIPSQIPRRPRSTPGSNLGKDFTTPETSETHHGRHASREIVEEFSTPSAEGESSHQTKRSSRRTHRSDGPPPAAAAPPDQENIYTTPVNQGEFARGGSDGSRGRTREQVRNDARRSFSQRIKEQFETYRQRMATADCSSADGQVGEPAVDPTSPGQPPAHQPRSGSAGRRTPTGDDTVAPPRSTSSDRCNAGTPSSAQMRQPEKSASPKQKKPEPIPEPEKPGRNWEDLIRSARNKYSSERMDVPAPAKKVPICADGVYSRWRLAKAEFGIPTSMAISSKGCVVVAEYGSSCLEFYDEGGAITHSMDGLKPFCVVVNDKDQVIVGDRKSRAVRIFDEFGGDVAHWDATSFNWICGLATLPGDKMLIYDRERCKLGVYSSPGEKIREFSSFGSNDSQLCMADFIAIDSMGRVLVADSGNHCVKAFDANSGTFLAKFGARGVADGCLDWPKGICVDANDNVIVTDLHNSRVSMFSPGGQFVRHLVTDVENPYSVCYSAATSSIGLTQYSLDGASQYDVYAIE